MGIVRTEAEYKGGDDLSPSFLIERELNEFYEDTHEEKAKAADG